MTPIYKNVTSTLPKEKVQKSDLGTIRYFDGTFYDSYWEVVYEPRTDSSRRVFMRRVNREEAVKGRRLLASELSNIVTIAEAVS